MIFVFEFRILNFIFYFNLSIIVFCCKVWETPISVMDYHHWITYYNNNIATLQILLYLLALYWDIIFDHIFIGLGYGSQVVVLYTGVYYIIILAWAFLYLFSSFTSELPWASCKNYWNTGTANINIAFEIFSRFFPGVMWLESLPFSHYRALQRVHQQQRYWIFSRENYISCYRVLGVSWWKQLKWFGES